MGYNLRGRDAVKARKRLAPVIKELALSGKSDTEIGEILKYCSTHIRKIRHENDIPSGYEQKTKGEEGLIIKTWIRTQSIEKVQEVTGTSEKATYERLRSLHTRGLIPENDIFKTNNKMLIDPKSVRSKKQVKNMKKRENPHQTEDEKRKHSKKTLANIRSKMKPDWLEDYE